MEDKGRFVLRETNYHNFHIKKVKAKLTRSYRQVYKGEFSGVPVALKVWLLTRHRVSHFAKFERIYSRALISRTRARARVCVCVCVCV